MMVINIINNIKTYDINDIIKIPVKILHLYVKTRHNDNDGYGFIILYRLCQQFNTDKLNMLDYLFCEQGIKLDNYKLFSIGISNTCSQFNYGIINNYNSNSNKIYHNVDLFNKIKSKKIRDDIISTLLTEELTYRHNMSLIQTLHNLTFELNILMDYKYILIKFAKNYRIYNEAVIKFLLTNNHININESISDSKTLLMLSSEYSNINMVKLLVEYSKADIHKETNGCNACFYSFFNFYKEIDMEEFCKSHQIFFENVDEEENNESYEIYKYLVSNGSSVDKFCDIIDDIKNDFD